MPVLVAPMSAMLMAHKEGEPATARAAVAANTCMVTLLRPKSRSKSVPVPLPDLHHAPSATLWLLHTLLCSLENFKSGLAALSLTLSQGACGNYDTC